MAHGHFTICFLLLFSLVLFTVAAYESEPTKAVAADKVDVVVEGMVYCQSCKYYGSWSLTGAEPIPSAKVSVICKNHQKQVTYYNAFQTDGNGYFYAQLDGYKMNNNLLDHPLQSCHVKPVSSRTVNCSLLTNINYGLDGAPLRYQNKILHGTHYQAVIYAAGPLAFRPASCPPETSV
ncbi:hypothetical protein K2173_005023 [Erythroxylum novogranatense]|uniref:Non-classical arabinogalactan protein 30 n=1 Tax=Erythroxylum novogranatense TaxID=1862640 RepID=A0AAV8TBN2_9ROSI|nr:hypothetical protein K2173_005023 [Erythroxylum novogranatense]